MKTNYTYGMKLAILTAVISGISIFVNKFAVDSIHPPIVFTATKNLLVGLGVVCLLVASGKLRAIKKLKPKEIIQLLVIAVVGGSIPFYLFFTGLAQVSAANSAFIQKTLVLWVAILAVPLLKERLTRAQILAVVVLFGANFMVGGLGKFQFSRAEFMVLAATIFWGVEYVVAKVALTTIDPDLLVAARMLLGSLLLVAAATLSTPAALFQVFRLSTGQLFWLSLTTVSLLLYVLTWYRSLRYAPVLTVSAVLVGSTLVTNVLSAVLVTHVWTVPMLFQAVLISLGVFILLKTEYSAAKKGNGQSLCFLNG